jgi:HEAT repeat protein
MRRAGALAPSVAWLRLAERSLLCPPHRSRAALACSLSLFCLLCPGPGSAAAQDAAEQRRLAQVLSGYESMPGEDYWRARGPDTVAVLQALFRDDRQPALLRLRAVRAASYYTAPRARQFLLSVAREPGQKDLFVREALLGLARAFGEQAAGEIAPFLDHEKPLVRKAAAEALGAMKAERFRPELERRLKTERDRGVRAALQQALK